MNPKELYDYVLDQSLAVALQVRDEDLEKPTPDSEWTVRDLMQHGMTELVWLPDMLSGKTVADVGDEHAEDLLGADPAESWRLAVDMARLAVMRADVHDIAHLSYANKPIGDYLIESANDILIHTWDLGQAIGVSVVFEEAVAQTLYKHMAKRAQELSSSGLFGQSVSIADFVNTQTKLLALLGRSEDWVER